jgi:hypothetical protein
VHTDTLSSGKMLFMQMVNNSYWNLNEVAHDFKAVSAVSIFGVRNSCKSRIYLTTCITHIPNSGTEKALLLLLGSSMADEPMRIYVSLNLFLQS